MSDLAAPMVREATEADLPALVELMFQLGHDGTQHPDEPRTPVAAHVAAFAAIRRMPQYRLLVLEDGGRVVGTAILLIMPNLSAGGRPRAIVENVVVDERERGQGYGAVLMHYCIDAARRAGCFKLQLDSSVTRRDAHRFYERLGFTFDHRGYSYALDG